MNKLTLAPDVQNYSVNETMSHVHTKLTGGRSRLRRDYTNTPVTVDLQWTCDEQEYNYLQSFYRVGEEGTLPFLMDLVTQTLAIEEHECQFVPGSFRLAGIKGMAYTVKAKIEAIPPLPDTELDEGIVTSFEGFGPDSSLAYALLQKLVNTDFPDAIGQL